MNFNMLNMAPAFCGVPVPVPRLSRFATAASLSPRRLCVSMRLRNSSKPYNPSFDRSKDSTDTFDSKPTASTANSTDQYASTAEPVLTSGGNGAVPPYRSNGNGRSHGDGEGSDDGQGGVDPEVLAVLRAAGRKLASVPSDARSANVSQIRRLLAVEETPLIGWLARVWPALRNRLMANERLPIQLGVELSVGFMTKTLAEVQGRGKRFWKEFDFYMSDLALELVGDAMLVWLLCPTTLFRGNIKTKGVGAFLQGLPKHALQTGAFSPFQRISTFGYKAFQFGLVGFISSMLGHGLTTTLVKQRRAAAARRGEAEEDGVELAAVVPTSAVWGLFMLLSSNTRYQLVNALEQRTLDPLLGSNALALTIVTFGVRFANCFAGGVQWLPFAKYFGIQ